MQVRTDGDSPEPQECKRTLVIYGSKGKSDELLLSPQTPGYVFFLPRATDEFIVSQKYAVPHRTYHDIALQDMYIEIDIDRDIWIYICVCVCVCVYT